MASQATQQGNGREDVPSFDLYVTFAGMCMLVPDLDRTDGKKRLHVLMPPIQPQDHGHEGHVVPHVIRLLYDEGHDVQGGEFEEVPHVVELENQWIDLTTVPTGDDLRPNLRERDVEHLPNPVPRDLLDKDDTGGRALCRITLGSGSIGPHNKGVRWKLGRDDPRPRHMAIKVEWKIGRVRLPAGQRFLPLQVRGFNGNTNTETLELFPNGRDIRLWVYHSPDGEDGEIPDRVPPPDHEPRIPEDDEEVHHFGAYYGLLDPPTRGKNPVFHDLDESIDRASFDPTSFDFAASFNMFMGEEFTCILAAAPTKRGP